MLSKIILSILPKMPQSLVWAFSKKYIVGKTLEETLTVCKQMNSQDYLITVDLLGEYIEELSEAEETTQTYLNIIEAFKRDNIKGGISVKPSFFGLLIDETTCFNNIKRVVEKAHEEGVFVRIDMEDAECTEREIQMYEKLHVAYPGTVGLVLQAYLFRTEEDVRRLEKIHTAENPINIRLCKGIYVEDASISYKKYQDINDNYVKIMDMLFTMKAFLGIATHDKNLVNAACQLIDSKEISKKDYEFQMLYGVENSLRKQIHDKGHPMKVYLPYGKDWFGYSIRRLKENPKMVSHIMKSIFMFK